MGMVLVVWKSTVDVTTQRFCNFLQDYWALFVPTLAIPQKRFA
jgi:hypothetical protein